MTEPSPEESLARLRVDIDRIDAGMHALLMERGDIIDTLIAIKARQGGGSAFRPGREAAMMRALAQRHRGLLPLDTVEGIWRLIISTFTFVQAAYRVHADVSDGDPAARDCVRFHFGFTVPLVTHEGPTAVIQAVGASQGDLGLVRIDSGPAAGAWWQQLVGPTAPKIIARFPFVERPDHPAGMPAYVLSLPLAEAAAREIVLRAILVERWRDGMPAAIAACEGALIGNAAAGAGLSLLVATPGAVDPTAIREAFREVGAGYIQMHEVGSHAGRFEMVGVSPASRAADEPALPLQRC